MMRSFLYSFVVLPGPVFTLNTIYQNPHPPPLPASQQGNSINRLIDSLRESGQLADHNLHAGFSAPPVEAWFDQKLDHFAESKTWRQRYFAQDSDYQPGQPVFVMIGGGIVVFRGGRAGGAGGPALTEVTREDCPAVSHNHKFDQCVKNSKGLLQEKKNSSILARKNVLVKCLSFGRVGRTWSF